MTTPNMLTSSRRVYTLWLTALTCAVCTCVRAYAGDTRNPYINRVYEYVPAPGQFINTLPRYESGDTEADMIRKVEEQIVGRLGSSNYICLGGWGGYVVFGFDHTIANVAGVPDLEVGGNDFGAASEPGVIYVSRDDNGNGMPDDTWYEIAGSEFARSRRSYSVTYYCPADSTDDVVGTDCDGNTVTILRNNFHQQAYYPHWQGESYTLTGTLLPNNITPGTMTLNAFEFGYADNAVNGTDANYINLDWAVDDTGAPARLEGIDFVRVQTGVCQDGMLMGETSTEVTGARDLHPEIVVTSLRNNNLSIQPSTRKYIRSGQIFFCHDEKTYNAAGVLVGGAMR